MKTNTFQLRWIQQDCSSSTVLDLAFWIIEHLSLCESLQPLSERHRFRLKEDIPGLQEEFNSVLPATVQFACKSWCLLTCRLMCTDSRIIGALHQLVRRWLPHWIAAMEIMGEVDEACQGLHQVEQWMVRIQASLLKILRSTNLCSASAAVWKSSNCILLTCIALYSNQRRHSVSLRSSSSQARCRSDPHRARKRPLHPNFPSSKRMMPFWSQRQVLCTTRLIHLFDFGITLNLFAHWRTPQMAHVWHPLSGINTYGCGA